MSLTVKRYPNKPFKIPFYDTASKKFKLKLKVSNFGSQISGTERREIQEKAVKYYLDNYLPEFYALRFDPAAFEEMLPTQPADAQGNPGAPTISIDDIEGIINDIQRSLQVENHFNTAPRSNQKIVIISTTYEFYKRRQKLEKDNQMPSFEANLQFFRDDRNLSAPNAETTLFIASIGTQNKAFNDGMRSFGQQYQNFEGQLSINVDFSFLQTDIQKILNALILDLVAQLRRSGTSMDFRDTDTLTIQFGTKRGKPRVVGMEYLVVEESIQSQPLKVGLFTAIKYNRSFRDPLSVATLKNYQNVVESIQQPQGSAIQSFLATSGQLQGGQQSFLNFLESPDLEAAFPSGSWGDNLEIIGNDLANGMLLNDLTGSGADLQNEMIKVAVAEGLLDINDTAQLENGLRVFVTEGDLRELKSKIADNPEVYLKVMEKQKARVLAKGVKVTSVIQRILEQGPAGLLGKNHAVSRLFQSLGIDQLIKEAILCATFGLNYEASRMAGAVGRAIQSAGASLGPGGARYYQPPPSASAELGIKIPKFETLMLKPKLKDGDVGQLIKTILVDALKEMAMGIISQIADLIKENCDFNNPSATDYGSVSVEDLLPPDQWQPSVSGQSQLDSLANNYNLSVEEIKQYLRDVSSILSSVDICTLFTDRDSASQSLIERIVEYNETYENPAVQLSLTSPTSVMSFYAAMSQFIDVSDLCEEIANTSYQLNQADVCLLLDGADLNLDNIQLPEINLECPDKENYINDPTITIAVPEAFNALVETVEVQFISAASSLKEVLLEPVILRGAESNVLSSVAATGEYRPVQSTGSLETLDPAILNNITDTFGAIAEGSEEFINIFKECEDTNFAKVFGFDAGQFTDAVATIVNIITTAVADDEFANAIGGINSKLNNIAASGLQGEDGPSPAITAYKFNPAFYSSFVDYIDLNNTTYDFVSPDYPYTAPNHFSSRANASEMELTSVDPVGAATNYTELELKFTFPVLPPSVTATPPTFEHSHTDLAGNVVTHADHSNVTGPHSHAEPPLVWDTSQGLNDQSAPGLVPDTSDYIAMSFPRFTTSGTPEDFVKFEYNSATSLILTDDVVSSFDRVDSEYWLNYDDISPPDQRNPYVDRFVQAYLTSPFTTEPNFPSTKEIETHHFPQAHAALLDAVFDYIKDNGIFDAATLQALNLFHLNTNCPADEVADFLDVRGILEQMKNEYVESACGDDTRKVPLRMKIRNVIKFGLYLLLIQMHIAEFIIKNIFVFSAFTIESLLEDRQGYLFKFFRSQVMKSFLEYIDSSKVEEFEESSIRRNLAEYFNLKVRRPLVENNGGIRFTTEPTDIVFPTGTDFSMTDESPFIGFDEIIDYMIIERLNYARIPINNAIKKALPDTNQIDLNEVLLASMQVLVAPQTITDANTGEEILAPNSPSAIRQAARIVFGNTPTVFLVAKPTSPLNSVYITYTYSMWYYDGESGIVEDEAGNTSVVTVGKQIIGSGDAVKLLDGFYTRTETSGDQLEGIRRSLDTLSTRQKPEDGLSAGDFGSVEGESPTPPANANATGQTPSERAVDKLLSANPMDMIEDLRDINNVIFAPLINPPTGGQLNGGNVHISRVLADSHLYTAASLTTAINVLETKEAGIRDLVTEIMGDANAGVATLVYTRFTLVADDGQLARHHMIEDIIDGLYSILDNAYAAFTAQSINEIPGLVRDLLWDDLGIRW
jgi:hypothetical protein